MKLIAIIGILWLSMWTPGHSQFNGCSAGFCGPRAPAPFVPCGGYQGPGDVIPGAVAGYSLRAWTAALCGNRVANVCVSGTCADMLSSTSTGLLVPQLINGTTCPAAGCTVHTLYEQTIGNNCTSANCDLVQATAIDQPVLVASCSGTMPCMKFTGGTSSFLQNTNGLTAVAQPLTMTVVSAAGGLATGTSFSGGGGPPTIVNPTVNDISADCGSGTATFATTTGPFYAYALVCNSGSSTLYQNASAMLTRDWGGTLSLSGNIFTGYNANNLEIAEIGVWSGAQTASVSALSANERAYGSF